MKKTYFITFEGIDGSGKDTQLNKLIEKIREDDNEIFGDKYSNIWITREPTKITKSGREISKLLKENEVLGDLTTKYFINDRKEHSKIIKEELKLSFVLSSRYDLSTFSYQMAQGFSFDELYDLHEYGDENGALIPDLTICFDLPVDVALERIKKRNSSLEFFETKEFLTKIRENLFYSINELKKRDGRKIIVVDANQPIEKVTLEMIEKIKEVLN